MRPGAHRGREIEAIGDVHGCRSIRQACLKQCATICTKLSRTLNARDAYRSEDVGDCAELKQTWTCVLNLQAGSGRHFDVASFNVLRGDDKACRLVHSADADRINNIRRDRHVSTVFGGLRMSNCRRIDRRERGERGREDEPALNRQRTIDEVARQSTGSDQLFANTAAARLLAPERLGELSLGYPAGRDQDLAQPQLLGRRQHWSRSDKEAPAVATSPSRRSAL